MRPTRTSVPLFLTWVGLSLTVASCSSCVDRSRPDPRRAATKAPAAEPVKAFPRRVRRAAVAGSWYPSDRQQLSKNLDAYLAKAPDVKVDGAPIALVSPHAGYSFSGKAAAAGYKLLRGRTIDRVVILGVAHRAAVEGASIADVTHYETPLGLIEVDQAAVRRLRKIATVKTVAEAHTHEHSLEMQLPLLQRVLGRFQLVPLLLGKMTEADYAALAEALAEVVDARTLVVASSDFTHRGPNYSYELPGRKPGWSDEKLKAELRKLDQGSVDRILKLDRKGLLAYKRETGTTVCGLAPVATLIELLSRFKGVKAQVLDHYTSGDVMGNWANTVTYVSVAFSGVWPARSSLKRARSAGASTFPLSTSERRLLLKLARRSLDTAVRGGRYDPAALKQFEITASLQRKAGAFVTLKCKQGKDGHCVGHGEGLRGCIGTIAPLDGVAATVAQRAASAALSDPRFFKVQPDELKQITVEVSVLTPPRKVKAAEEIVIGRHGIVLSKGGRSATYLPQVAPEQGWDRDTALDHLGRKAGLAAGGWRQGATFMVYEAIVFTEGEQL
jgi:AmmeMemoRadiSam system protein B/AmmeMemoRadiSam system protein A